MHCVSEFAKKVGNCFLPLSLSRTSPRSLEDRVFLLLLLWSSCPAQLMVPLASSLEELQQETFSFNHYQTREEQLPTTVLEVHFTLDFILLFLLIFSFILFSIIKDYLPRWPEKWWLRLVNFYIYTSLCQIIFLYAFKRKRWTLWTDDVSQFSALISSLELFIYCTFVFDTQSCCCWHFNTTRVFQLFFQLKTSSYRLHYRKSTEGRKQHLQSSWTNYLWSLDICRWCH